MAAWSDATTGDLRPGDPPGRDLSLSAWAARVTRARSEGVGGTPAGGLGQTPTGGSVAGAGRAGPREVHWVDQVHGATVVTVPAPVGGGTQPPGLASVADGPGDALVTAAPAVALAVLTADCASVALGSPEGVFAAVHAGWRGLVAEVVPEAVGVMRGLGATDIVGALGPCIHAECYEFSEPELTAVCDVVGQRARGRTSADRPALDLPAAVSATLRACGVVETAGADACTACQGGYFSHRARGDLGRQALLVWSSPVRA